jgi:hypothetical protein
LRILKELERIYNGDFIERIAKLEGLLPKKWLRK